MIGQTISHYKILEKLGEGGMGVVYKAQDTKLDRIVAIKFLPSHLSASENEKARFIQEAKAASAFNHPNVATIYEIDEAEGESFIVMEYVEGQTLREVKSSLSIKRAVEIGIQIAEGIAAAHDKGIVHRDIKAENIMVRKDSRVQVMDFGLAKLRGVSTLTKAGSTVGTLAYMSPEQVQGIETDHRTDIFSLGVVLYELLAGQLPFKGEHEAALMYEVLNVNPPPLSTFRRDVEPELERIITKCLEKEREERYQSAKDIAVDLKRFKRDSRGQPVDRGAIAREPEVKDIAPRRRKWMLVAGAALVSIIAVVIILTGIWQEVPPPQITSALPLTSAPGLESDPTWSPDGTRISYVSDESGNFDIWVQQIAAGQRVNLTNEYAGSDYSPAWSPDGEWIAFISDRDGGGIFVMPALGGTPRRVFVPTPAIGQPTNISWSPDGRRLAFTTQSDIYVIPAGGGPTVRTASSASGWRLQINENAWSPGGSHIAYTEISGSGITTSSIWSAGVDGKDPVRVTDGKAFDNYCVWGTDGKELFFISDRGGSPDIWWVAVDSKGKPTGLPKSLTVGVGVGSIALSRDGKKLAYSKTVERSNIWSMPIEANHRLTLDDAKPITTENHLIETLSGSPDGEWIAFCSNRSGNMDIWVMRKDGKDVRQVTTDKAHDWFPTWSPDGKEIAFHSLRTGNREIYVQSVEGGAAKQLTNDPAKDWVPVWSPTGTDIAFGSDRSGSLEV